MNYRMDTVPNQISPTDYVVCFAAILTTLSIVGCSPKTDALVEKESKANMSADAHLNSKILKEAITINGIGYTKLTRNNDFVGLLAANGDTIVPVEDYYSELEIIDIDKDQSNDLRVYFFSNTPNQCDNYLFDKKQNSYRLIEDCSLDIQKIDGSDFYFSYNRAGCADMNWHSHLSKIENFRLITYGFIDGRGCDADAERDRSIDIYRIDPITENKTLIKQLPYKKNIPRFEDKFGFIERYWEKEVEKRAKS